MHDSSGLLIGPTEPTPKSLTIVVSNDNGGGIFELLEQGDPRFSDVSSRIFGTPHDVDVGGLCRAYHVDCRQVEVDGLADALERAGRRHARAGGEGRPFVAAGVARVDQGGPVIESAVAGLKALWRSLIPHLYGDRCRPRRSGSSGGCVSAWSSPRAW